MAYKWLGMKTLIWEEVQDPMENGNLTGIANLFKVERGE